MKGREQTSGRWAEREVGLKMEKETIFFHFQNYSFHEKNNLELAR
jgi:hypothetical protein